MKLKKIFISIYISVLILFIISLTVLSILGNNERVGYLGNLTFVSSESSQNNYIYSFRINYYDKIFRNSDIYGVYLNTNSLPDYIKEVKMNKDAGTPFGTLVSFKKLEEDKIDNIKYTLQVKYGIFIIIILLISLLFIFIYNFYFVIFDFVNLICSIKPFRKIKLQNRYLCILIIFLCFLIMPNIIYKVFYDKFDHTNYENRNFAEKPNFDLKKLDNYPKLYETYFNDYIPFRNELTKLKNLMDLFVFRNLISNIVLLGKEKWLFFKYIVYENYIAIDTYYYSDEELEKAKNILLNFKDELKKQNIDFIFMICPNKESIYTNYIPSYIKTKKQPNISEKFVEYIRKNTDVKILYPREQLMKYKDKYQLYYKYDHHWNALGAYIAYSELMKLLSINVKDLESLNIFSFDYQYRNNSSFYNQTANSVHLSDLKYFKDDKIFVISNFISKETNIMINRIFNWGLDYYYTNKYSTNTNNIYIIRDSMTQELLDYIFPSFKETTAVSYEIFDKFDIIKQRPDIVIYSIFESDIKWKIFDFMSNFKIEEINKDLEANSIVDNN